MTPFDPQDFDMYQRLVAMSKEPFGPQRSLPPWPCPRKPARTTWLDTFIANNTAPQPPSAPRIRAWHELSSSRGTMTCGAVYQDGSCACTRPQCIRAHAKRTQDEHEHAKNWTTPRAPVDLELALLAAAWSHRPIEAATDIEPETRAALLSEALFGTTFRAGRSRPTATAEPRTRRPLSPSDRATVMRTLNTMPVRRSVDRAELVQQVWLELLEPSTAVAVRESKLQIERQLKRAIWRAASALRPRINEESTDDIEKVAA